MIDHCGANPAHAPRHVRSFSKLHPRIAEVQSTILLRISTAANPDSGIRRATRILPIVHELHKRGYPPATARTTFGVTVLGMLSRQAGEIIVACQKVVGRGY